MADSKAAKDTEKVLSVADGATGAGDDTDVSSATLASGDENWRPTTRMYMIFVTMMIITLMVALDATSLSVALPIMAEKLKGTAIEAFWSGTSFLLTSTVFQPIFASLSNIFGRKPLIITALVFFTAGCIVAGVANNFTVILVGRSIQGLGGGGVIALTEIIMTDIVPLRQRGKFFGFLSMMWAIGSVSGPLVGGAFAQNVTWRWIFYINLPFAGAGFLMVPIFLRLKHTNSSLLEKLGRIDWAGSVIFISSTTSLLIGLSWGGVMYPWDSWRTLVPILVGFAGIIGFIFYERMVASDPVIRLRVFKSRTALVNYAGTFLHGVVLWCALYYLPLYYEGVKGYSPIIAGVAVFPQTFTVAPASVVVGIVVTLTGRFRWALWVGWSLSVAGLGLVSMLGPDTTVVQWVFLNFVSGLGLGMLFPAMGFAIQAAAEERDAAYAVAMFSFFRAFGQAFGVAIGGVIFQNAFLRELKKYPGLEEVAGEYARDAVSLVQSLKRMPGGIEKTMLKQAYSDGLRIVWLSMIGFTAAALLLSLLTEPLSLDRALESEQQIRDKKKVTDEETKPEKK